MSKIVNLLEQLQAQRIIFDTHGSQFGSLLYLNTANKLVSIDFAISALDHPRSYDRFQDLTIQLTSKIFNDPFTSFPTTTIYSYLTSTNRPAPANEQTVSATLVFWLDATDNRPLSEIIGDPYRNFRADIVANLELMSIPTQLHYGQNQEMLIGFTGNSWIDLVDNLVLGRYVISNIARNYNLAASFSKHNAANLIIHNTAQTPNITAAAATYNQTCQANQLLGSAANSADNLHLSIPDTANLYNLNFHLDDL